MDFKEKRPVSLDKSKIECYNCHRKGHFARECRSRRSQGKRPYGDNGRSNAQTTESLSQALVAQDVLGGYDWSNDFEVEPVNYALMAISSSRSSSSSDSEVQKCSKCLESFKCLQKNYDTERDKHNKAKLEIRGYEIALESLEARILGHEKNELAWEGSSKNLTKILNTQMSTHDKNGLGFGTQIDDLSNKSETDSENSLIVFEVRSSDEESTLAKNRFTKANEYHAIPPPITGNPLTPRVDISFVGLDEYAFRNKIIETKTTETNKTVDEVIIEDWTSNDEDDECAVKTVSSVKPNVTQAVRSQADKSGQTSQKQGIGSTKVHKIKACFVCKSTDHLIKDCDFYKSLEPRVKNVVNTRERVVKPVWDYGKRVNHQNFSKNLKYPHAKRTFNPSAVLTRAGLVNTDRSNVSTARSISTVRPVSTARPLASKIAQSNSVIRPNHPRLDIVRPKASNSPIKRSYFTQPVYRPKDLKPDVKTFGVKNMTTVGTRAVVSKGKVENVLKKATRLRSLFCPFVVKVVSVMEPSIFRGKPYSPPPPPLSIHPFLFSFGHPRVSFSIA
ncbi:ribonuclease H-like domain-containing protein [Tanacetum coccineum]